MRRRSWPLAILAVLILVLLGALVTAAVLTGNSSDEEVLGPADSTPPTDNGDGAPTTVLEDCETGSGEWALDETLHGVEGRMLNSGMPGTTAEAAIEVLQNAARQDPLVLGQLLLDYGVGGVPSLEELRCVEVRKDWWLRLDGIFRAAETNMVSLGEALDELGIPISGQDVTITNSMVVDGNVEIVDSVVNVGEQVLSVKPPGATKPVFHRTFCANKIVPPGEEVILLPPGVTPIPVPSPTPPPGVTPTPTPPGATPTPTPTPRTTPTPTPTRTPTPTPTPTPAPPDFRVLAEGADRELNYENGLIQFRANFRVVVFNGSTTDIAPFTYRWYVDGVFQGSTNPILFWVWPGDHEMYVVVKDKFGRSRESNHVSFHAGSIPPSPDPDFTPTPVPTPVPGGSDDDDDGCTGGCMP